MNFIFTIFLLIVSVVTFVFFIDPHYKSIKKEQEKNQKYETILKNFSEIKKTRDDLLKKANNISEKNRVKIDSLVPDNVKNILLILEIEQIVRRNGIPSIKIISDTSGGDNDNSSPNQEIVNDNLYKTADFSFAIETDYIRFKKFLKDLYLSLRILDVKSITATRLESGGEKEKQSEKFKFQVDIKTYWI